MKPLVLAPDCSLVEMSLVEMSSGEVRWDERHEQSVDLNIIRAEVTAGGIMTVDDIASRIDREFVTTDV